MVVAKYKGIILDKWVPSFPALSKTDAIGASAAVLFGRFYLSNSVMEFDPLHLALAAVMVASKAEGTMGFLPALAGIGGDAVGRDESIQEAVPLVARPGKPFGLISAEPVGDGGFCCVVDPEAAAVRDKVLEAEMVLLEGTGFHLLMHHPFAPFRALLAILLPLPTGDDDEEGKGSGSAPPEGGAPPPAAVSSSAGIATTSNTSAARASLASAGRAWMRKGLRTDSCLLESPSTLALAALVLAVEDVVSSGGDTEALLGLTTRAHVLERVAFGLPNGALGPRAVVAAERTCDRLRAAKAPKASKALAKLQACAVWRLM